MQQEVSDTLRGANLTTICVDALLRDLVERFWSRYVDAMHRGGSRPWCQDSPPGAHWQPAILHNRMLIACIFASIMHHDWVSGALG